MHQISRRITIDPEFSKSVLRVFKPMGATRGHATALSACDRHRRGVESAADALASLPGLK